MTIFFIHSNEWNETQTLPSALEAVWKS